MPISSEPVEAAARKRRRESLPREAAPDRAAVCTEEYLAVRPLTAMAVMRQVPMVAEAAGSTIRSITMKDLTAASVGPLQILAGAEVAAVAYMTMPEEVEPAGLVAVVAAEAMQLTMALPAPAAQEVLAVAVADRAARRATSARF